MYRSGISDMKIDQESVGWWCQMMVRPGSAAHAALVGGQRRCGWSRPGPAVVSLGRAWSQPCECDTLVCDSTLTPDISGFQQYLDPDSAMGARK